MKGLTLMGTQFVKYVTSILAAFVELNVMIPFVKSVMSYLILTTKTKIIQTSINNVHTFLSNKNDS